MPGDEEWPVPAAWGLSTGPKTGEGIERSRQAVTKHGRYSAAAKAEARYSREILRDVAKHCASIRLIYRECWGSSSIHHFVGSRTGAILQGASYSIRKGRVWCRRRGSSVSCGHEALSSSNQFCTRIISVTGAGFGCSPLTIRNRGPSGTGHKCERYSI